jgi:hypothetical protein
MIFIEKQKDDSYKAIDLKGLKDLDFRSRRFSSRRGGGWQAKERNCKFIYNFNFADLLRFQGSALKFTLR